MFGVIGLLIGCAEPVAPSPVTVQRPSSPYVLLDGPRLLRRIRLDLGGRLPDVADLDVVEADPDQVWTLADGYLDDPLLGDRLVELWGERWGQLRDDPLIGTAEIGVAEEDAFPFARSSFEEPLRLMAHVAVNDLPWDEVVTADYTLGTAPLARLWPLDTPADAEGWVISHYTDGRPMSGILSSNGLWWRHITDESNANRGRAAAISRLLLCEDFLSRPISFSALDVAAVDEASAAAAIQDEPACAGCHSTLDPLAANLFGFWWFEEHNISEIGYYHAEREALSDEILGTRPGWFGQPLGGLADLGGALAADPRFSRCTAEHMAAGLWRREVDLDDHDQITALTDVLEDSDRQLKALLGAILRTEDYRAGGLLAGAGVAADRAVTRRMLSPDQLSDALAALTGFHWTHLGVDMMNADTGGGYRVLAGGADGELVRSPQTDPGLTWALTTRRLAEAAAGYAVDNELVAEAEGAGLLRGVTLETPSSDPAFTAQLSALHWRLLARRPTEAWLSSVTALWDVVEDKAGAEQAWVAVLVVLFSDPDFVTY